MNLSKSIASILLLVAAAGVFVATAEGRFARRGPPTICFPVQIGDATTIPDDGGRASLGDRPLDRAVVEVLDKSDVTLVHMETLRRSYFLAKDAGERNVLLGSLKDRVLKAEIDDAIVPKHARALAWFDLGYFTRILEEGSGHLNGAGTPFLDKALRIDDTDGAMYLGAAYASCDSENRVRFYSNLAAAHARTSDPESLLGKNLLASVERFCPKVAEDGFAKLGDNATLAAKAAGGGK